MDAATTEAMVLDLLADAGDACLSGEMLSSKLGLDPADVFHQIDRLRAQGYRIDTVGRQGYRLVSIPDRLTALEVVPFLTTHDTGRSFHHYMSLTSTNEEAFRLAREGAFHGETVVAEHQTGGKGRRGRSWFSPPGKNLYVSVVVRPELPAARAPELTFVAALAVVQTLRDAFGVEAKIKWPNDVLVDGRKVAGILTELDAEGDRVRFAVVGIGINVNLDRSELPDELRGLATSVRMEMEHEVDRPLFTAAVLSRFEAWYDVWLEQGFAPVREAWSRLSDTLGRRVRVVRGEDAEALEGEAMEIDADGGLRVRDASGEIHRVVAGDVHHLRAAEPPR